MSNKSHSSNLGKEGPVSRNSGDTELSLVESCGTVSSSAEGTALAIQGRSNGQKGVDQIAYYRKVISSANLNRSIRDTRESGVDLGAVNSNILKLHGYSCCVPWTELSPKEADFCVSRLYSVRDLGCIQHNLLHLNHLLSKQELYTDSEDGNVMSEWRLVLRGSILHIRHDLYARLLNNFFFDVNQAEMPLKVINELTGLDQHQTPDWVFWYEGKLHVVEYAVTRNIASAKVRKGHTDVNKYSGLMSLMPEEEQGMVHIVLVNLLTGDIEGVDWLCHHLSLGHYPPDLVKPLEDCLESLEMQYDPLLESAKLGRDYNIDFVTDTVIPSMQSEKNQGSQMSVSDSLLQCLSPCSDSSYVRLLFDWRGWRIDNASNIHMPGYLRVGKLRDTITPAMNIKALFKITNLGTTTSILDNPKMTDPCTRASIVYRELPELESVVNPRVSGWLKHYTRSLITLHRASGLLSRESVDLDHEFKVFSTVNKTKASFISTWGSIDGSEMQELYYNAMCRKNSKEHKYNLHYKPSFMLPLLDPYPRYFSISEAKWSSEFINTVDRKLSRLPREEKRETMEKFSSLQCEVRNTSRQRELIIDLAPDNFKNVLRTASEFEQVSNFLTLAKWKELQSLTKKRKELILNLKRVSTAGNTGNWSCRATKGLGKLVHAELSSHSKVSQFCIPYESMSLDLAITEFEKLITIMLLPSGKNSLKIEPGPDFPPYDELKRDACAKVAGPLPLCHDISKVLSEVAGTVLFHTYVHIPPDHISIETVLDCCKVVVLGGGTKRQAQSRPFKILFKPLNVDRRYYGTSVQYTGEYIETTWMVVPQTLLMHYVDLPTRMKCAWASMKTLRTDCNCCDMERIFAYHALLALHQRRRTEKSLHNLRYVILNSLNEHSKVELMWEEIADKVLDLLSLVLNKHIESRIPVMNTGATLLTCEGSSGPVKSYGVYVTTMMTGGCYNPVSEKTRNIFNIVKDHKQVLRDLNLGKLSDGVTLHDNTITTPEQAKEYMESEQGMPVVKFSTQLSLKVGIVLGKYLNIHKDEVGSLWSSVLGTSYAQMLRPSGMRSNEEDTNSSRGTGYEIGFRDLERHDPNLNIFRSIIEEKDWGKCQSAQEKVRFSFSDMIRESASAHDPRFYEADKVQRGGGREIYVMDFFTKLRQYPIEKFLGKLCKYLKNEYISIPSDIRPKKIHKLIKSAQELSGRNLKRGSNQQTMYLSADCRRWGPQSNILKYIYMILGMGDILPLDFTLLSLDFLCAMLNKRLMFPRDIIDNSNIDKTHLQPCGTRYYCLRAPYTFVMGICNYLSSLYHAGLQMLVMEQVAKSTRADLNLLCHSDDHFGTVTGPLKDCCTAVDFYQYVSALGNQHWSEKKTSLGKKFAEYLSIIYINGSFVSCISKFTNNCTLPILGAGYPSDVSTVYSKVQEQVKNGANFEAVYLSMKIMAEDIAKIYHLTDIPDYSQYKNLLPPSLMGTPDAYPTLVLANGSRSELVRLYAVRHLPAALWSLNTEDDGNAVNPITQIGLNMKGDKSPKFGLPRDPFLEMTLNSSHSGYMRMVGNLYRNTKPLMRAMALIRNTSQRRVSLLLSIKNTLYKINDKFSTSRQIFQCAVESGPLKKGVDPSGMAVIKDALSFYKSLTCMVGSEKELQSELKPLFISVCTNAELIGSDFSCKLMSACVNSDYGPVNRNYQEILSEYDRLRSNYAVALGGPLDEVVPRALANAISIGVPEPFSQSHLYSNQPSNTGQGLQSLNSLTSHQAKDGLKLELESQARVKDDPAYRYLARIANPTGLDDREEFDMVLDQHYLTCSIARARKEKGLILRSTFQDSDASQLQTEVDNCPWRISYKGFNNFTEWWDNVKRSTSPRVRSAYQAFRKHPVLNIRDLPNDLPIYTITTDSIYLFYKSSVIGFNKFTARVRYDPSQTYDILHLLYLANIVNTLRVGTGIVLRGGARQSKGNLKYNIGLTNSGKLVFGGGGVGVQVWLAAESVTLRVHRPYSFKLSSSGVFIERAPKKEAPDRKRYYLSPSWFPLVRIGVLLSASTISHITGINVTKIEDWVQYQTARDLGPIQKLSMLPTTKLIKMYGSGTVPETWTHDPIRTVACSCRSIPPFVNAYQDELRDLSQIHPGVLASVMPTSVRAMLKTGNIDGWRLVKPSSKQRIIEYLQRCRSSSPVTLDWKLFSDMLIGEGVILPGGALVAEVRRTLSKKEVWRYMNYIRSGELAINCATKGMKSPWPLISKKLELGHLSWLHLYYHFLDNETKAAFCGKIKPVIEGVKYSLCTDQRYWGNVHSLMTSLAHRVCCSLQSPLPRIQALRYNPEILEIFDNEAKAVLTENAHIVVDHDGYVKCASEMGMEISSFLKEDLAEANVESLMILRSNNRQNDSMNIEDTMYESPELFKKEPVEWISCKNGSKWAKVSFYQICSSDKQYYRGNSFRHEHGISVWYYSPKYLDSKANRTLRKGGIIMHLGPASVFKKDNPEKLDWTEWLQIVNTRTLRLNLGRESFPASGGSYTHVHNLPTTAYTLAHSSEKMEDVLDDIQLLEDELSKLLVGYNEQVPDAVIQSTLASLMPVVRTHTQRIHKDAHIYDSLMPNLMEDELSGSYFVRESEIKINAMVESNILMERSRIEESLDEKLMTLIPIIDCIIMINRAVISNCRRIKFNEKPMPGEKEYLSNHVLGKALDLMEGEMAEEMFNIQRVPRPKYREARKL